MVLVYIIIGILTLFYLYSNRTYSYWKDRNVFYKKPIYGFGNMLPVIRGTSTTEVIHTLYNEIKSNGKKFGGFYSFFSPQLLPVDLDLVKSIMQKDFAHFPNHGFYIDEERDPLSGHLFNLEDEKWRNLRAKLTPTFTSGKIRMMFQTLLECTNDLKEMLENAVRSKEPADVKNMLACFTTDVIGSIAFGIEINSMKNPDSDFRKYGEKIFTDTGIRFTLLNILPRWISKMFNIKNFTSDTEDFYMNLVKETVAYREKNNIHRKDFLHLLIQLKNYGKVSDDNDDTVSMDNKAGNQKGLSVNEMVAQVLVFYLAGYETSASTMTFALLELAQHQDIQDKVRDEINAVIARHDNKITYDSIMEMSYLEKVVLETLRKHPPVSIIPRCCKTTYKVPDSDLVLEAGTKLSIPVYSIQRDPENFPDPENFDPERFNEENNNKRHPFAFLPFGEGPRLCIGLRFGKLQSKVGLCTVLRNYKVTLNEKTKLPIQYENGIVISVKGGVWLNLEPMK